EHAALACSHSRCVPEHKLKSGTSPWLQPTSPQTSMMPLLPHRVSPFLHWSELQPQVPRAHSKTEQRATGSVQAMRTASRTASHVPPDPIDVSSSGRDL